MSFSISVTEAESGTPKVTVSGDVPPGFTFYISGHSIEGDFDTLSVTAKYPPASAPPVAQVDAPAADIPVETDG